MNVAGIVIILVIIGIVFVIAMADSSTVSSERPPTTCTICSNLFKRVYHKVQYLGETHYLCPACEAIRKRKISKAAFKRVERGTNTLDGFCQQHRQPPAGYLPCKAFAQMTYHDDKLIGFEEVLTNQYFTDEVKDVLRIALDSTEQTPNFTHSHPNVSLFAERAYNFFSTKSVVGLDVYLNSSHTRVITEGSADIVTGNGVWILAVLDGHPNKEMTLRLLVTYLLLIKGPFKVNEFNHIGIFNPKANMSYHIAIKDIDEEMLTKVGEILDRDDLVV